MACLLGCCLMLSACSSSEEDLPGEAGKGAVRLSLSAGMGFDAKTKAVNEGNYLTTRPIDNYKVRILDKKDGSVVPGCDWKYSELPTGLIELPRGNYTIEAFDGEEFNIDASTRDGIYMYGETPLDIDKGQVEQKTVACRPACGKLVVTFGQDMEKYFSAYEVRFKTKAIGEGTTIWQKTDTDPLYVKLDKAGEKVTATFHITTKGGKTVDIAPLTRDMKWGTMWTINVNPKVNATTGNVGITIEFDDSTNNKPIDIEIPSDWL